MKTVCIASLSTPLTITRRVWSRIESAGTLFLQSELHPCAKPVLDAGLSYTSMDDLYASAENFDALQEAIAQRLIDAGDCVLAMTGAADALLPVLERLAKGRAHIEVLPGVPMASAAFPADTASVRCCANALPARIDPSCGMCIEELDSRLTAGEVKLALTEYYPDGWTVALAHMRADGTFAYRSLPLSEIDRQKHYDAVTLLRVPPVPFERLERYGFDELITVLNRLRAPGGCPWDREQTHASIKESLLEECYEAMDAIDRADDADMAEELGDVLLQVAFHAVIATEQGRFTARDILTELVGKLIYRHPHVFGTVQADTSEQVLKNWDALKKTEKRQETYAEVLRSVPRNFPALLRSRKVQKRASGVGFDWDSADAAFFKIAEEAEELRRAMQGDGSIEEEVGDLLFAVVNVARLLHLEPEFLLASATDKFIDRFARMEALATADGKCLETLPLAEQDGYWDMAKA